ncbi:MULTISPECIES: hypothetical protein [Nocardia]|uniref:Secreted protein n=1 Tax=Nocardia aurea TaxID=2144174 RepID=A0ABV3G3N4_9NOCA|nr:MULTISPECIES: hypothetical protein [Nocardia]
MSLTVVVLIALLPAVAVLAAYTTVTLSYWWEMRKSVEPAAVQQNPPGADHAR